MVTSPCSGGAQRKGNRVIAFEASPRNHVVKLGPNCDRQPAHQKWLHFLNKSYFSKLPPLVTAHGVGPCSKFGFILAADSGVPNLGAGSVYGVFFVFVAVVVIVIAGGATGGEAVENETA